MKLIHSVLAAGLIAAITAFSGLPAQAIETVASTAAQTQYNQGANRLNQGDVEGAIEAFTAAVALDPRFVDAYCERGLAYALAGDTQAAVAGFEQAIDRA